MSTATPRPPMTVWDERALLVAALEILGLSDQEIDDAIRAEDVEALARLVRERVLVNARAAFQRVALDSFRLGLMTGHHETVEGGYTGDAEDAWEDQQLREDCLGTLRYVFVSDESFNRLVREREASGPPPLHEPDCSGSGECGDVERCLRCRRFFGRCSGDDADEGTCLSCWLAEGLTR